MIIMITEEMIKDLQVGLVIAGIAIAILIGVRLSTKNKKD